MPTWLGGSGRGPAASDTVSAADDSTMLRTPSEGREVRVIDLIFDVAKVELPIDGVRHSRKIWNHVDELKPGAESLARLARNGLRVGVASPSAWPPIRTILDAADSDVRRDPFTAEPGHPLVIELAVLSEPESIFSYSAGGRLVGKTLSAGVKLMSLDYAFHPELGGVLNVELGFEVRRDLGAMTWEHRNGSIRQVPDFERHVFTELTVAVTLTADEFLVIGLNDQARNEYLVGHRFLVQERAGRRFETMFFVTPKPFQAEAAPRPGP